MEKVKNPSFLKKVGASLSLSVDITKLSNSIEKELKNICKQYHDRALYPKWEGISEDNKSIVIRVVNDKAYKSAGYEEKEPFLRSYEKILHKIVKELKESKIVTEDERIKSIGCGNGEEGLIYINIGSYITNRIKDKVFSDKSKNSDKKNSHMKNDNKKDVVEEFACFEDTNSLADNMLSDFFGVMPKKTEYDILFERYFSESDNIQCIPDKIEPIVKKLENKKYRVKYASPGHSNTRFNNDRNKDGVVYDKLVSTARIIFERDYHFDNTPKGWKWKVLSNGFKALYVKPFTYNEDHGNKNEAFRKWQSEYLSSLNKWVEDLPMMGAEHPRKEPEPDNHFSS